jgi:hypothetical protein
MLVQWQKDFELGLADADAEHRQVVDLLNELDICLVAGAPPQAIEHTLQALSGTLARHLHLERVPPHPLLERAERLVRAWQDDAASPRRDDLRTLAHWWLIHLCCHAQQMAPGPATKEPAARPAGP